MVNRLKNRAQDFKVNFKNKVEEYKEKPKSKRKSFSIGFTTAVAIFGLTLFGPALSAVASDIANETLKPPGIAPVQPPKQVIDAGAAGAAGAGISGLAASACSLAITSGSFAVGVVCGCIVVVAILRMQAK